MNTLNLLIRRLISPIDSQLDKLTSYKLVLYFLYTLVGWSILGSLLDKVAFTWYEILISAVLLAIVCRGVNLLVSRYLNVPKNNESDLITAMILTLILSPGHDFVDFLVLVIAAAAAMLSKYILVISRWHIFNPAAFGAFVSGELLGHFPSWWVGTSFITPVVFLGGMLVLRKMKRFIAVIAFEVVALIIIGTLTYLNQSLDQVGHNLWIALVSTPLLFFAYIMLTEPLTSPRRLSNYLPYSVLVAFMYAYTKLHISPEEALLIGNAFAYLIEPNRRIELKFLRKVPEAAGIESFLFSGKQGLKYDAGQYMEWTLPLAKSDFRGNRRYFSLSSSPTEKELMFTVRMPEDKKSSFKQSLEDFKQGGKILAAQLSGEFTLPKSEKQKLAFLAGGVGITPFRSMVKYALDFNHERDIHLLYSANSKEEFAFRDLFEEAQKIGLQTTYSTYQLNVNSLKETIPDYMERVFYISGPYGFVHAMESNLLQMGVPVRQIKTDYFPGYGN